MFFPLWTNLFRKNRYCEEFSNMNLEGIAPWVSLLLTSFVISGVPKITLRFNTLLEELTKLTENYYTHGTVYYRETKQIKISQGKKCIGHYLGNYQRWSFPCLLPVQSGCLTFLALMFDTMHGVLPAKQAHLILGIQVFLGLCGLIVIDYPCGWSQALVSSLSEHDPSLHPKSHCYHLAYPRPQANKDLRDYFPEAEVKGQFCGGLFVHG